MRTVLVYSVLGLALVGWFLHGLFIERQGLVDSMGESLGSAFGALLIISIIGSFASGRRSAPPARQRPGLTTREEPPR